MSAAAKAAGVHRSRRGVDENIPNSFYVFGIVMPMYERRMFWSWRPAIAELLARLIRFALRPPAVTIKTHMFEIRIRVN